MNYYFKVLSKYATFEGRARRKEYWYYQLFNTLISVGLMMIDKQMIVYHLYILLVLLPGISVAVRRMHDVGKSGWYLLIPIYSFILACREGDKFENKYGSDPKL